MLRKILKQALADARRLNIPQRRTLFKGLSIEVAQNPTGDVQLLLSRSDVAPSQAEWDTVLKHWPERLPADLQKPSSHKEGRRYALVGRWPRPAESASSDAVEAAPATA